ncbi:MAG: hypothetical protein J7K82_01605 [Thermoproteales archaeon]|nr:hypothetical protein [Thermoproteales archaeon]
MTSLKPVKCPVCGAPLYPAEGQKFFKCEYCGTIVDLSTEKERKISWYHQPLGFEKVLDKGVISLKEALDLVDNLSVSPTNPPNGIPETIGFQDESGSFIEFTRYSMSLYDVRYENLRNGESLIGYDLPLYKVKQMLIDFFEGRDLRWKKDLKPY